MEIKKHRVGIGLIVSLILLTYTLLPGEYYRYFSANLLESQIPAFDGTYFPIQSNFYYTTMYLGSYSQLGVENVGDHAGVDFAAKRGTPVYALANGLVTTAKYGYFGEGNYVVIKHVNVPTLEDENILTTYNSVYLHLESSVVNVDQIIKRGQLIGYVGSTGNSTGPHLHLQLDENFAPFHPYWTSDAVKVADNTINPLQWIDKYKNFNVDPNINDKTQYTDTPGDEHLANDQTDIQKIYDQTTSAFDIQGDSFALVGNAINLTITALDYQGGVDNSYAPNAPIVLTASNENINFSPNSLDSTNFVNGVARVLAIGNASGEYKVQVDDGNAYGEVGVYYIEDVKDPNRYIVDTEKRRLEVGQSMVVSASAVTTNGELVPNYRLISDHSTITVEPSDAGYFEPEKLVQDDFKFGEGKFRFIATKSYDQVRIKVQEGVFIGYSNYFVIDESTNIFPDVSVDHPYYDAISYLKKRGIIQGYTDGTFRPTRAVSRAELLKIILLGLNIPVETTVADAGFADVPVNEWFVPYVQTAKNLNIVQGYPDGLFRPHQTVNKVEALKIVLKTKGVDLPTVDKNIFADVRYTDWYAPYVQFAIDNDIVDKPTNNTFNPGEDMDRGMISDVIYRMEKRL